MNLSGVTRSQSIQSADGTRIAFESAGQGPPVITDNLTGWAARVAGHVPHARHLSLQGEWHTVPDTTLAPVLVDFFRGVDVGVLA